MDSVIQRRGRGAEDARRVRQDRRPTPTTRRRPTSMLAARRRLGPEPRRSSGKTGEFAGDTLQVMEALVEMLGEVGVTPAHSSSKPAATSSPGARASSGDWDILGNGYGNQTGLAITNLIGHVRRHRREGGQDARHLPRLRLPRDRRPDPKAAAEADESPAQRPARAGAAGHLGHRGPARGPSSRTTVLAAPRSGCRLNLGPTNSYTLVDVTVSRPEPWPILLKRLGQGLLTVFLTVTTVFVLIRMAPGDPAVYLRAVRPATPEQLDAVREQFGLDQRVLAQYWIVPAAPGAGQCGQSPSRSRQTAMHVVSSGMPYTLTLATAAILLTAVVAIPLGRLDARRPNTGRETRRRTSRPSPGSRCPTSGSASCWSSCSR